MTKVIGIDIGYGQTKVAWQENGAIRKASFPSLVGAYVEAATGGIISDSDAAVVKIPVGDDLYIVGDEVSHQQKTPLNYRGKDWINSIAYKVLCKYAIVSNRLADRYSDVLIVTGLPVNYVKTDTAAVEDIIRGAVAEYFGNMYVWVVPQPYGSFCHLMFNDNAFLRDPNIPKELIGVLDIGYYTSDFITIKNMRVVESKMDSYEHGVSTILAQLRKDYMHKYQITSISPSLVEQTVLTRQLKIHGEVNDVSNIVNQRLQNFAKEILGHAKNIWGDAHAYDRLIISGGGAALVENFLADHMRLTVCDDARFANALGYLKYGVRLASTVDQKTAACPK